MLLPEESGEKLLGHRGARLVPREHEPRNEAVRLLERPNFAVLLEPQADNHTANGTAARV